MTDKTTPRKAGYNNNLIPFTSETARLLHLKNVNKSKNHNFKLRRDVNRKDYLLLKRIIKQFKCLAKENREMKNIEVDFDAPIRALFLLLNRYTTRLEAGEELSESDLAHMESLSVKLLPYSQPRVKPIAQQKAIDDATHEEMTELGEIFDDIFKGTSLDEMTAKSGVEGAGK